MKMHAKNALILVCGVATALLIAGTVSVTVSRTANATPAFAQQTSKPCAFCHENQAGGGKLKPAGEKFKANGNKL